MNGNTPYAGRPGVAQAGHQAAGDRQELSPEQCRRLERHSEAIAALTRQYLPDEYVVNADVSHGLTGPELTVAVHPPAGHAVSAGFTPDPHDLDAIEGEDEIEAVARELAATAALQVKRAVSGGVTPTAR